MTFYFCDDFHDNLCSKKPLIEGPGWSVAKTKDFRTPSLIMSQKLNCQL